MNQVTPMLIIDSHVHIFQPRIALAAVLATNSFYEGSCNEEIPAPVNLGHLPGTAEDLMPRMEKDGVDRAVVFSTATAPHQVEIINRFIRDTCKENPSLIGVGTMHPDYPDFEGEVKRMKEFGLVGIKLHPDIQRFKLDDERLMPLYEIMSAEHLFLIISFAFLQETGILNVKYLALLVQHHKDGKSETTGIIQSCQHLLGSLHLLCPFLLTWIIVHMDIYKVLVNHLADSSIFGNKIRETQAPRAPVAANLTDNEFTFRLRFRYSLIYLLQRIDFLVVNLRQRCLCFCILHTRQA